MGGGPWKAIRKVSLLKPKIPKTQKSNSGACNSGVSCPLLFIWDLIKLISSIFFLCPRGSPYLPLRFLRISRVCVLNVFLIVSQSAECDGSPAFLAYGSCASLLDMKMCLGTRGIGNTWSLVRNQNLGPCARPTESNTEILTRSSVICMYIKV